MRTRLPVLIPALALTLGLALAAPPAARALDAGPRTPAFSTSDGGAVPAVASGADGGFAVLWVRQDGTLAVRAFTASGAPAGPEHTVFHPGDDGFTRFAVATWDVAALPDGGYVAVWEQVTSIVTTFSSEHWLQRLDDHGQPAGASRKLEQTANGFSEISIAVDRSGLLTVLWDTEWYWDAQRFNLEGVPQSLSTSVASDPTLDRVSAAAILPDGGFALARVLRRNGPQDITLRLLRPDGTAAGPGVPVHAERAAERDDLVIAAGAAGHSVVAWRDKTARQILVRLFGPDGRPLGAEVAVATMPAGVTYFVAGLAVRPDGSFLVQWGRDKDLLASAFSPDGARIGGDALLDRGPLVARFSADAAATPGGWISTWSLATAESPTPVSSGPWLSSLTLPCGGGSGLCLNGHRFRAEVSWSVPPTGAAGLGRPIPQTGDTGSFWFFAPTNEELSVKVLDGRGVNGYFWVFYASLTDVAFELTVTDTATGQTRTYRNPAGTMASRADTRAFRGEGQ